jgi:SAM-dependent methyltransferase
MPAPQQSRPSLATGFRNVDESGAIEACTRCLDVIAAIPFFSRVKEDSCRIIADAGPGRVLDAGCGSGTDLVTLANMLPDGCEILGVDASGVLLARARERTASPGGRGTSLVKGDLRSLPFHSGTVDACRIDRVLQHISMPVHAVRELARVLAPGGLLVAFDNDWETFRIQLDDPGLAGRICRSWRDSFAAGRVGRDLGEIFTQCGVTGIGAEPRTLVLSDLQDAEQVFDIPHLLDRMVQSSELTVPEAAAVREDLARRAASGTFSAGYTGYLVWGTRRG